MATSRCALARTSQVTVARNEFANLSFATTTNQSTTKERHSYENEKQGQQCNHRGDTIEMDTAGADDVDPSRGRGAGDSLALRRGDAAGAEHGETQQRFDGATGELTRAEFEHLAEEHQHGGHAQVFSL